METKEIHRLQNDVLILKRDIESLVRYINREHPINLKQHRFFDRVLSEFTLKELTK